MTLEHWRRDLRLACRRLWRAKAFTAAAVLTLATGIAGTTLMFALVQGVLLRPLPVHEQDRLIVAWKEARSAGSARYPFGDTAIEAVADSSRLLEDAAGVARGGVERLIVRSEGSSSYANVAAVTGGFFDVLGVAPAIGRTLALSDDREGAEPVVVVSSGFWRRRFGASRDAIGRLVVVGEQPLRIVGVMPPDLDYPAGVELWRTTTSLPPGGPFGDAARQELNLLGRLRPGVTVPQAASEIAALSRELDASAPENVLSDLVPVVRLFEDVVIGDVRTVMLALFGAVWLVLLIATANVANLLLVRGDARSGELALRAALGAARGALVRQLFAESVVVATLAGAVGLAVAWSSLRVLVSSVPDGLPRVDSIRIDPAVVTFAIAIALLAALMAGIAPALRPARTDLSSWLRGTGDGLARPASRGRRTLVVAQVALAVTVIAAAGLLIRTVLALQSADLGLPVERLVLLDLHVPQATRGEPSRHAQFLDEAMAQIESVPSVAAATPVNVAPFSGQGWDVPRFTAEGQSVEQATANPSLNLESVHPNYFDALQIPVVRGRAFTAADRNGSVAVAIVSDDVAARAWPGQNPIGRRLKMGGPDSTNPWYTVVGIADRTRYRELRGPRPTLYLPAAQFLMTATMFAVRTTAPLNLIVTPARDRIQTIDPDVQIVRAMSFGEMLAGPLARPRFSAFLVGLFGIAALLLSTVGVYAVMTTSVRQRQAEIGLRVALGATAADVRRLVVRDGLLVAGLGAALGLGVAAATGQILRGVLYEVHPLDPAALLAAALLVAGAAAGASYLPARRAARLDPLVALRSD